jgi:hypothetical protein
VKRLIGIFFYFNFSVHKEKPLASNDEMNASNNAPPPFRAKSVAPKDAPVIELSAPKLSVSVNSPTPIEFKFPLILRFNDMKTYSSP